MSEMTCWVSRTFLLRSMQEHEQSRVRTLAAFARSLRHAPFARSGGRAWVLTRKAPMTWVAVICVDASVRQIKIDVRDRALTPVESRELIAMVRRAWPKAHLKLSRGAGNTCRFNSNEFLFAAKRGLKLHRSSHDDVKAVHRALNISPQYAMHHQLSVCVEPAQLQCIDENTNGRSHWLTPTAARAYAAMRFAARHDGVHWVIHSSFRSIAHQAALIQNKLRRGDAIETILTVNAAPGFSEHHTGRALDFGEHGCPALEESFEQTESFAWLEKNAPRFGFQLSYPRDNPHGIAYEPWHWCWHAPSMGKSNSSDSIASESNSALT